MIRILFHPAVLLLITLLVVGVWMWAHRVDLRVRLTRLPTPRDWAIFGLTVQLLRWFLRWLLRLRI